MVAAVTRTFRYRCYPTDAQAAELTRTFGCVRKVYNMALAARIEAWKLRQEHVGYTASSAMLTAWKRTDELAYLNEVSSVPLQQALRHLESAFTNFFAKRARYPRFKTKRRSRSAAEYTSRAFRYRDGRLTLAKMREHLDVVWSRPLPEGAEPSTVTVSRDAAGRWFVAVRFHDRHVVPPHADGGAVGIDVGIHHLITLSTGETIENPKHERRDRARLARAQRSVSRKVRGDGANRAKARQRAARIHARIADRRHDHLHKLTTRLVRENQTLVVEDLVVHNMVKNHHLARAISDAGWRQFRTMLEYKANWYGRTVLAVDRWFPSSKLCSNCGETTDRMPLALRAWTCPCGAKHDRDVNAARNILAAGLAVSACGADVRPQQGSSRTRRPAVKQEAPRVTEGPSRLRAGGGGQAPQPACVPPTRSARIFSK
ncbi:RNA-guided endonuclease TnpB family protein [Dactylosporangium sp. NPDC005572]|uniref:RNA-guided endonuclease InsQ/TnpB family protein n=1 Tax=Dactylosporangium sp. NPDC005572 TaxID=3156889 RepID=UPI0033A8B1BC